MTAIRMQERDLDLLLMEELYSDSGFAEWIAGEIGLSGHFFVEARHSISAKVGAKWGETDVLVFFTRLGDGLRRDQVAVLVEDKISARFTDRQAERYHERAREIVRSGDADRHLTLLVAPSAYLAGVPEEDPWDRRLAIETITDWFSRRDDAHARWRTKLLTDCLTRLGAATMADNSAVTRFGAEFATYLKRHHAPILSHVPGKDPAGPTIHFQGWSGDKLLWWKLRQRRMALQLQAISAEKAANAKLPEGISREMHGRCIDFFIEVPEVDLSTSIEEQHDSVEAALNAAYRLIALLTDIEGTTPLD